ncbi:DUF1801 domain-containing protein [Microbacterium esteraromaticum]|uniref:DUF1801 domain-containing protein n=1 Tax=Microbacterium esteraromaticum TaxID=57043 RepID=A0A7D8AEZ3_9MICO|nr:DUF1801 domain-containing protein [Microbacterium esteraromaticum]QMU96943.1 DUF1801 domain-containing protein [Microbacterium esteraromaticum]
MTGRTGDSGFSAQERAAMKARNAELKAEARREKDAQKAAADAEDVRAKIASMPDGDREMAERLHALVAAVAPDLAPKLYYGQPGYARGGKVVVFFRSGQQDKLRYSTFGLSPEAALDESDGLWPTSYALIDPTDAAWKQIEDIVRRA